ncbi:MAG: zinc ribbon domain-containing protein [Clostridia bacterium]|nr:zinc ribbon domain-containing protein [Clostridia bacterium]
MYCTKCGQQNLPEARFCVGCGNALSAPVSPTVSPAQTPTPAVYPVPAPKKKTSLPIIIICILVVLLIISAFIIGATVFEKDSDAPTPPVVDALPEDDGNEETPVVTENHDEGLIYNEDVYSDDSEEFSREYTSDSQSSSLGEPLVADSLLEFNFSELYSCDEVLSPGHKEGDHTFYPSVSDKGQTYVVLCGEVTNLSDKELSLDGYNMYFKYSFDGTDSYEGLVTTDFLNEDGTFHYDYIIPSGVTRTIYFIAEIPTEDVEDAKSCSITFGFDSELSYDATFYGLDACDYILSVEGSLKTK